MQRRQFLQFTSLGLAYLTLPKYVFAGQSRLNVPAALQGNPLLDFSGLPAFSKIKPEHVKPAIDFLIAECRTLTDKLSAQTNPTWQNFYLPLADVNTKLSQVWTLVGHLKGVKSDDAIRKAHEVSQKSMTDYSTWAGQHQALYQAYLTLKASPEFQQYDLAQQKAIDDVLLDFRLSGISLPEDKRADYAKIMQTLSELGSKFSNNVLDATAKWEKRIQDPAELAGLSERALAAAKESAESKNQSGYRITLDYPSYSEVMTYCENAALREEVYKAYVSRASELSDHTLDNSPIIDQILAQRFALAKLLDFDSYADYSLATKMAENPQQVLDFLNDLVKRSRPQAQKELAELAEYAKTEFGVPTLKAWDVAFYSQKQKNSRYAVNDEALRPYFPEQKVLAGLFEICKRLFNLTILQKDGVDVWDDSVRFFDVFDGQNQLLGSFYFDPYARENKRSGAWMNGVISRQKLADGSLEKPVAFLVCNFTKPLKDKPSLLLHQEVETLFHEFGHTLHHLLTQVEVVAVSGINGVPWDAVEYPSQMLENWCWQAESLKLISGHIDTGEPLPDKLLENILQAQNYQFAYKMGRQLQYGLLDFRLHTEYQPTKAGFVRQIANEVEAQVSVVALPPYYRFENAFNHIFAGGYAAGYYSYMWADVLAADSFSRFAEEGILNREVGQAFVDHILSQGGTRSPMALFKQFRGREPRLDALLKQQGIL
ncbi:oligopeptidase A [Muribacter muris]|uniref:oligopeptidase A n=1 Tax=Muribacter muris TaxID=67855 RepID=A0A4Y9K0K4_9PAST|nr:oligopeptidase A [Muribacter muris]MBF0784818.1 oligopeptidase A [Muribacter muris]MBF0826624.1 oligopeptidase A [Muribacter muris]TFV11052.1 oligopeptidase A [Muribacter muris]